jgi:hypothetical protein
VVAPAIATVVGGQALTFIATVTGNADTTVTWSIQEGSGCGTVAGGVYASPMAAAAVTCHVVATSHADTSKSASATVSVTPTPQAAAPTFSPAVGTYTGPVTVTLTSTTSGAVIRYTTDGSTPSGSSAVYSSPLALAATTTIRAIAQVAGSRDSAVSSGTYSITAPAVAVVVAPTTATAVSGEVLAFTATVTGSSNTAVTWSVEEASCGSVTSGGAYSAPTVTVTTTCHVRATSQADTSKYARATITVSNAQDADLSVLAGRAICFGHQSVGANIMNGVRRAVAASTGTKPTVASVGTSPAVTDVKVGRWDEGYVGANYDPISKINAFQAIMASAAGGALDGFGSGKSIAMMKFRFVDVQGAWYLAHGDADLFAAYQAMVNAVAAQRPNVRLVHFTMPRLAGGLEPHASTTPAATPELQRHREVLRRPAPRGRVHRRPGPGRRPPRSGTRELAHCHRREVSVTGPCDTMTGRSAYPGWRAEEVGRGRRTWLAGRHSEGGSTWDRDLGRARGRALQDRWWPP